MLEAALDYARKGLPVFPVGHDKTPRTRSGFKDATTDLERIRAWWEAMPDARIGIPTGKVSGVTVIDVDPQHGGDETFRDLEADLGGLPTTPCQTTPSGGTHYFLTYTSALKTGVGRLGPGVDVRSDGGYVVVAPSPGYDWDREWTS